MNTTQCQEETKARTRCANDAKWAIETPSGPGLLVCGAHKRLWTADSPERAARPIN